MTDLRKEARGKPCMIRLPGCDGSRQTTVGAHYRLAGYNGTGQKPPDIMMAWSCNKCHDLVDGRVRAPYDRGIIRLAHAEGVIRTVAELWKAGKIKV